MVARIVNTVMEVFLDQELELKRRAMSEASRQLQSQAEELRANLEATRAKVLALESRPSVVTTGDGTVISQRLVTLAKEEQQVDNDEASVRADLDQVDAALKGGRSNILNPELVTPRLKVLLETSANLRQTMAQTAIQLGPKHPQMQALAAELTRVQQETTDEIRSIRDSLKGRRATLDQRRVALQADAQKLGQQAAVSAEDRAKLQQLQADEQSQQQLYETYQQRYRLTLANLQVIQPGIRVVSRAVPPVDPSSPGRALLTVAGGVVGALLAIAFILGRRWWKGGIDTPREVSLAAGVPALGGIPRFSGALLSPERGLGSGGSSLGWANHRDDTRHPVQDPAHPRPDAQGRDDHLAFAARRQDEPVTLAHESGGPRRAPHIVHRDGLSPTRARCQGQRAPGADAERLSGREGHARGGRRAGSGKLRSPPDRSSGAHGSPSLSGASSTARALRHGAGAL